MASKSAIVIGSGPNGLSAAITLARAGWAVQVLERGETVGGSARSAALTLPGFVHDICSTVHALARTSPFLRELPLESFGLKFIHPEVPFAHPLDDGTAVLCERSVEATCANLGEDGPAYAKLFNPLLADWETLLPMILGPISLPRHPIVLSRFAKIALRPACAAARSLFRGERARALFAGAAAHSVIDLNWLGSSAYALMLIGSAHAVGWPIAEGGSQNLSEAMAAYFRSLGGEISTSHEVRNIDELSNSDAVLCDMTPRQLIKVVGNRLPRSYLHKLQRYQYGPGVFKLDWALDGPIPWTDRECLRAGTIHIGGTMEEIAASEAACWRGEHSPRPYVLLVQPTLFDPTRSPIGKHIAWAYCHVPNGSDVDMTKIIEDQIERFAPGFRKLILARHAMNCAAMESHNPNLVGGDISGGAQTLRQVIFRPNLLSPYRTPVKNLYVCSASTPPGGGVHGMCGFNAAQSVLKRS